ERFDRCCEIRVAEADHRCAAGEHSPSHSCSLAETGTTEDVHGYVATEGPLSDFGCSVDAAVVDHHDRRSHGLPGEVRRDRSHRPTYPLLLVERRNHHLEIDRCAGFPRTLQTAGLMV